MPPAKSNTPPVVLYHYDASPFADKIRNVLVLKRIPHSRVEVSYILPRPELSDLLGISYRRIPVLAIGNDVYCDTSIITAALERRFPATKGYSPSARGTIFPPRNGGGKVAKSDKAFITAFAKYYIEDQIFPPAAGHVPYEKMPADFLQDRSQMSGGPIDVKALVARRDEAKSTLASHLALLEEQLGDGREWLADTAGPSLADVSAHFLLVWTTKFRTLRDLIDPNVFAKVASWLSRMSAFLESQKVFAPFEKINADAAAKTIVSAQPEDLSVVGFVEVEARRLDVKLGDTVSVAPKDTGRIPTTGKLLALNREEVVIETVGSAGIVHCHFPRLGFSVKAGQPSAKL
ncbi:hypothetical protein EVJ58_g8552 [Rhodofomes roseus]|uniref:Glutathione S-transferase n=1 Tax=Rhodofomes roseus TaxID=34475 RepID=A0A4Y9XXW4_9APHY|nr:hypothetical protein EVJ58_g8552 [Rhodofomes roseus]